MKVSREQVAENRRRILDAASRLFRGNGFEAVTVAEVMKAAGLTHGGFYGYFKSKDDLIAETLAHALAAGSPSGTISPVMRSTICRRAIATISPADARRRASAPRPCVSRPRRERQ